MHNLVNSRWPRIYKSDRLQAAVLLMERLCILQVPGPDQSLDAMCLRLHNEARAWPPLVARLRQVGRLLEAAKGLGFAAAGR